MMENRTKRARVTRVLASLLFAAYVLWMLYLLFFQRLPHPDVPFSEYVASHVFLVPFRFLWEYVQALKTGGKSGVLLRNIFGNILLFLPPGLYLPYRFKRLRSIPCLLLLMAAVMLTVELLQLFTKLGTCELDDILLNLFGVYLGALLYRAWEKHRRKNE